MNPAQNQNQSQALTTTQPGGVIAADKDEIRFKPFGSDDEIKLSIKIIRDYVAIPAKGENGEPIYPEQRDCMRFMMLCRAQRLNVFAGDGYLLGYRNRNTGEVSWSLITAHEAFIKRAELHPDYNGIEHGVIVLDTETDEIKLEPGDFVPPKSKLLGGWATVHFHKRERPSHVRVKLETYQKPYGVWTSDPAGMIVKVARVHALRIAFPTMLGGMLMREEYLDVEAEVTDVPSKRPEFAKGLPAPNLKSLSIGPEQKPAMSAKQQAEAQTAKRKETAQKSAPAQQKPPEQTPPQQQQQQEQPPAREQGQAEPADDPGDDTLTAEGEQQESFRTPFEPRPGESQALTAVRMSMHTSDIEEAQVMAWARESALAKAEQKSLADLAEAKLDRIAKNWGIILPDIKKAGQPA